MGKIKFIYFDVGEVLVKGARSRHVAAFLGIPYETFRPVFKKYQHDTLIGKMTTEEFFAKLQKDLPITAGEKDFAKLLTENLQPITATHNFLEEIKKSHKIGFLTNLFPGIFDEMKKKKLIPSPDEHLVVGSWQEGMVKPDKSFFLLAQQKADVRAEEILLIDDNEQNVATAKSLGWQAIIFDPQNPIQSIQEVKKLL